MKALQCRAPDGGAFVAVPDEAILRAILPLARLGGVFAEPAGAAAFAGLQQAVAESCSQMRPLWSSTPAGLKDIDAAIRSTGEPTVIPPTLDAVKQTLGL
ncbi:MAG: hypothetical protein R2911_32415 [Caldilineaceae bacterium]